MTKYTHICRKKAPSTVKIACDKLKSCITQNRAFHVFGHGNACNSLTLRANLLQIGTYM